MQVAWSMGEGVIMKASLELQQEMKRTLEYCFTSEELASEARKHEEGLFPRSPDVKDLNRRFRFDVFYTLCRSNPRIQELAAEEGLFDSGLETVLERLLPVLRRRY